jgi:hypothetical protein
MDSPQLTETLRDHVKALIEKGHNKAEIESMLAADGHDSSAVNVLISTLKKEFNAKRSSQGIMLITVGSAICLVGFLMSVVCYNDPGMLQLSLYGITTLGLLLVFAGFVLIF